MQTTAYVLVSKPKVIDQFRYIKIQPNTKDLSTRLWGKTHKLCSYFPEPVAVVYCIRLTFNILKLV